MKDRLARERLNGLRPDLKWGEERARGYSTAPEFDADGRSVANGGAVCAFVYSRDPDFTGPNPV